MTYPGGKGQLYQKIINLIPIHDIYIEPFVGGGAVLRNKRPARSSIAIDSDTSAINKLTLDLVKNGDSGHTKFIVTDAIKWLERYTFTGNEFIYLDPPYLMSTRRCHRQLYRCELSTEAEHSHLLDIVETIPSPVMISGYMSQLYAIRLKNWYTRSFKVRTRGGSWATEYIWMNYPAPVVLHDYQHLGDTFRERERIKRKTHRWVNRLQHLPRLERQAILSAINEVVCD